MAKIIMLGRWVERLATNFLLVVEKKLITLWYMHGKGKQVLRRIINQRLIFPIYHGTLNSICLYSKLLFKLTLCTMHTSSLLNM